MKLPNWLKAIWWGFLTLSLTYFLLLRIDDAIDGKATPADIFVFIIWFALLLAPLFSEIEIFGVKLKKEIQEAGEKITREVAALRAEVSNAVDVRTNVSPNIYLHQPPPPDSQLPTLKEQIKAVLAEELGRQPGPTRPSAEPGPLDEPTLYAFQVRRAIDLEIKRIARQHGFSLDDRVVNIHKILRSLVENEVIDKPLEQVIRDLYRVCSPAIHGDELSDAQASFIRDVAPGVLEALRAIRGDDWWTQRKAYLGTVPKTGIFD
jgi:hypothetical protein